MASPPRPGTIGRYQITSKLGEGAMGVVYKALDPVIGRMVAIKTVRTDTGMTGEQYEDFTRRFIQEARIAGTLSHPNIVTIYDVGQWQDSPFIAMEFLEGQSLMELLAASSPFTPSRLVNLLAQMARGLDFAHEHKVVHRDIKPGNIMVLPGDRVKLMDFGIAKIPGLDTTQTGVFLGSPNYTAPEQIVGNSVDHRADIFSLGIVAFELLTGALPFPGDSITSVLYSIVHKPPEYPDHRPRIETLDQRWQAVFNIVLDKNPDRRFQRAEAFLDALGESVLGRRPDSAAGPEARTTVIPHFTDPPPGTVLAGTRKNRRPAARPSDVFRGQEEVPDSAGAMDLRYRPLVPGEAAGEQQAVEKMGPRPLPRVSLLRVALTLLVLFLVLALGAAAALQFGFGRPEALFLLEACTPAAAGENSVASFVNDWLDQPDRRPRQRLVRLSSDPPGASIRFGTRQTGQVTPVEMTLPFAAAGRNLVTFELEGYLPGQIQFAIGEAPPQEISLTLKPDLEELQVLSSPPGAVVSVDGEEVAGTTPLKLRIDRYRVAGDPAGAAGLRQRPGGRRRSARGRLSAPGDAGADPRSGHPGDPQPVPGHRQRRRPIPVPAQQRVRGLPGQSPGRPAHGDHPQPGVFSLREAEFRHPRGWVGRAPYRLPRLGRLNRSSRQLQDPHRRRICRFCPDHRPAAGCRLPPRQIYLAVRWNRSREKIHGAIGPDHQGFSFPGSVVAPCCAPWRPPVQFTVKSISTARPQRMPTVPGTKEENPPR